MASIISAGTTSATALNMSADTTGVLQLSSNNGTVAATVDTSQRVGVGLTTLTERFEVNGAIGASTSSSNNFATGNARAFMDYVPGSNTARLGQLNGASGLTTGKLSLFNNGLESIAIDAAGRIRLPYQPSFLAGSSAGDTTVTTGSLIPFNSTGTSGFNVGSGYNTASYLFTAPIAGKYFFSCVAYYTNSGGFTNDMQLAPIVNGAQVVVGGDAVVFSSAYPNNTGGTISIGGSFILNLAANDAVGVYNRTGFSIRLYMGHTKFSGYLIG
jgi:hypothetical protein